MSIFLTKRKICRLCDNEKLDQVLKLTPTPPANAFVPQSKLDEPQECFPLNVYQCLRCGHVQLLDVLDPRYLFENYVYVSGTSPVFVKHFEDYARSVISSFDLPSGSLVVEAGSNDGTLLQFFQNSGMRVLGIDPAGNIARMAMRAGIETITAFLCSELARQIRQERGPSKVVIANNVFAHVDDLIGFASAVRELLADDGIYIFEVSYLVDVYEKTLFDTIYHEHLSYHTVGPLKRFFTAIDLELIEALRVDTHGGSLRGIVQRAGGPRKVGESVTDLIKLESKLGLDKPETMKQFASRIDCLKQGLQGLLQDIKRQRKRIAGYGAAAKATTLMYHFGLDRSVLEFVVDDSPLKQDLYSPGLHVPVLPSMALYEKKPNYILILAWNFAKPIIQKHKALSEAGGKFIIPIPKLEII